MRLGGLSSGLNDEVPATGDTGLSKAVLNSGELSADTSSVGFDVGAVRNYLNTLGQVDGFQKELGNAGGVQSSQGISSSLQDYTGFSARLPTGPAPLMVQ